jgi:hypothetical protein
MHAVISGDDGSTPGLLTEPEPGSKFYPPDGLPISSRSTLTNKSTAGDVYDTLRNVNGRFVEATGGLGLEDPVIFEAWTRLNGSVRCDPLLSFHLKLEEQKAQSTSRLSSDQASKLAMLSSDLDRLFEDLALAVKGKTSSTPAPSSEAVAADLPVLTYSKKTRRATLASAPIVPPPVSASSFAMGSRPAPSGPIFPSSSPGHRRAASMSQAQHVSFILPGPSTEVTYGGYPIQPGVPHDAAPNPPSSTAQGICFSPSLLQSKIHKGYSITGRSSHMATAPDNILNLDGVNQPDKDPAAAGTGPPILRRRELDSTSITNGNFRYANRNDIIPVILAPQAASQGSHGTAYRSPASTTPRDGEIARPGRTVDGHEIRYYDSCMVVGPDSAVVPYLPEGSRDVPGTLMQHRPHSRRR